MDGRRDVQSVARAQHPHPCAGGGKPKGTSSSQAHGVNLPSSVESTLAQVCVFTAPLFSAFCALAAYLFVKEIRGQGAGLTAAAFMAMVPSYISRSVAGSYDNEGVAIFALVYVFYLYVKVGNQSCLPRNLPTSIPVRLQRITNGARQLQGTQFFLRATAPCLHVGAQHGLAGMVFSSSTRLPVHGERSCLPCSGAVHNIPFRARMQAHHARCFPGGTCHCLQQVLIFDF